MEESQTTTSGSVTVCSECSSLEVMIKKGRKAYCKICWKYHCDFRFRKRVFEFGRPAKGTVGEVFKPAENVLIYYDGSPSSVALINLALNAMIFKSNQQSDTPGLSNLPFPFKFCVLVLLESDLNGSPGVEVRQKKHLHSLLKWTKYATNASEMQFPLYVSCIEMAVKEYHDVDGNGMRMNESPFMCRLVDAVDDDSIHENAGNAEVKLTTIDNLSLPFNESLDCHLMELRRSLKSKTEDKDFVSILKSNLTNEVAKYLQVSKVLVPEDQTSLAVKMFSMMSLGRGLQVADEMSFTSTAETGITLARPLVDFSDDDLRSYLETLSEDCTDGIVNKGGKRKMKIESVERQCNDFIVNLQKGYPATVSTLTRIGAKLQSYAGASTDSDGSVCTMCIFCQRQSESASPEEKFCYGCQHFLNDAHPDKKKYFENLFLLKNSDQIAS